MLLDIIASFSTSDFIATHDTSGMQLIFDKIVGSFQKFRSNYDDGSSSVSHFLILQLWKLHYHFGGRVFHIQLSQDSRTSKLFWKREIITIICYRYIPDIIHQHLVQSRRAQCVFHDICYRQNSSHYSNFLLPLLVLTSCP